MICFYREFEPKAIRAFRAPCVTPFPAPVAYRAGIFYTCAMRKDSLEKCAQRMTATLARRAPNPRSRQLLASLPKLPGPRIVRPEDYVSATFQSYKQDFSFLVDEPHSPRDRRRPGAELQKMRLRLHDAQDGKCGACGKAMPDDDVTIDHVVPKARGGANHFTNYLAMHAMCNAEKGSRMPNAFEIAANERKNVRMQG